MKRVCIIGSGITGLTCARLLTRRGWAVKLLAKESPASPTLILNEVTCSLLQDIWDLEDSFWYTFHLLYERQVCWDDARTAIVIPQPSVVIRGNKLSESLLERLLRETQERVVLEELADLDISQQIGRDFPWIIDASGRTAAIAQQLGMGKHRAFGNRRALCQEVILAENCAENTYCIETVADSWVFLAPLGERRALLQVMFPSLPTDPDQRLCSILQQADLIEPKISSLVGLPAVFSAFPQILEPLCGRVGFGEATWMAVGDAAFAVDPISGDGSGYGIRAAILSTSVLDGIACGLVDYSSGLHHYTSRLQQAFSAHLKACLNYYAVGFSSQSWQAEIDQMQEALAHDEFNPSHLQGFSYQLQGFELVKSSTLTEKRNLS